MAGWIDGPWLQFSLDSRPSGIGCSLISHPVGIRFTERQQAGLKSLDRQATAYMDLCKEYRLALRLKFG